MSEKSVHELAANVTAACLKFRSALKDDVETATRQEALHEPHPSVRALTRLLAEHEELLARLDNNEQPTGRPGDHAEIAAVAAKREKVLVQGLNALGSVAVSMRAVLDDVGELLPADNGYLPSVQEVIAYGHRLRYTTFATTGLYSGEPAPQQLHFDHAALWERALAERHQQMAAPAAAAAAVDPRAEAACRTLLDNLVEAGWTPAAGFPEPVLEFLSDMPGAMDVLRRLVEERFFKGASAAAGEKTEGQAEAATAGAKAPAAGPGGKGPVETANPASRLVRELMLDEETDEEEGSSSEYTSTEDGSD